MSSTGGHLQPDRLDLHGLCADRAQDEEQARKQPAPAGGPLDDRLFRTCGHQKYTDAVMVSA